MSTPAIEARDLTKHYPTGGWAPSRAALSSVDLVVEPGAGLALIGPNGAGKSTLLMLIAGLRHPTAGSVRVLGADPMDPHTRRQIGVLADRPALYPESTVTEHLALVAAAHRLSDPSVRIAEVMGRLELGPAQDGKARLLSAGMQRRLALALALLPAPALLLLDEPFSTLDPASVRLVADALTEERARGVTVVVATHRLGDLVGCCNKVSHVIDGSIQRLGEIEHLLVRLPVRVVYSLPPGAVEPTVGTLQPSPPGLSIRSAPAPRRDTLIEEIRMRGGAVLRVTPMLDLLTQGIPADIEETLA